MGATDEAVRQGMRAQCDEAARRLLASQQRDLFVPTHGCFDRRYWAWKMVELPDATLQRNVHPLAMLYRDPDSALQNDERVCRAVGAGILYLERVQHRNGAIDQAFVREFSFAATAFVVHPLMETHDLMGEALSSDARDAALQVAERGAWFLCTADETHGVISNHLAAAALSLLAAGDRFGEPRFIRAADRLLDRIRAAASPEGWLREYNGADPGYQSLAIQYLARIAASWDRPWLADVLERAVRFLAHFVHPDGSFGGCYGSRRTSVCYPAGLALLGTRLPLAKSVFAQVARGAVSGRSVSLREIDLGNLAPLLTSWIGALHAEGALVAGPAPALPWEASSYGCDFFEAGLHVRVRQGYQLIVGTANGGTVRVNAKHDGVVWNDGGYLGEIVGGAIVSSQHSGGSPASAAEDGIACETDFVDIPTRLFSPWMSILLHFLSLSALRSPAFGRFVKRRIVRELITPAARRAIRLTRRVRATASAVEIVDVVRATEPLRWLTFGRPFVGVHMASAGYPDGANFDPDPPPRYVDLRGLERTGAVTIRTTIRFLGDRFADIQFDADAAQPDR